VNGSFVGKAEGGKLLRLDLEWESDTVVGISIRGDFFAHPEEGFEKAEAALVGAAVHGLGRAFADALSANATSLFGLLPEDVGAAALSIVSSAEGRP
jgi:hypothetical protein